MVGDWTTTTTTTTTTDTAAAAATTEKQLLQRELKRKFDEEEHERKWNAMDEDERAMRGFKIQTKTYPPGSGGERAGGFRPMVFKGKGKEVKKEDGEAEGTVKKEEEDEAPRIKKEDTDAEGAHIKAEAEEAPVAAEVKKEGDAENGSDGIVFKKRKVKNIRKKI